MIFPRRDSSALMALHQRGTSPVERWYPAGLSNSTSLTTSGSPTANVLRAMPFVDQVGGPIDAMGIFVQTTSIGNLARWGIYLPTSRRNLYPGPRLYDGGDVSTTGTGVKSTTPVNIRLEAEQLYWFVLVTNAAVNILNSSSTSAAFGILGIDSAFGTVQGAGWSVSYTYAALPAAFPAGAAAMTPVNMPTVACRFKQAA